MSIMNSLCPTLAYANDWNPTRAMGTFSYIATVGITALVVYLCLMRRKRRDPTTGMGLWIGLLLCQLALLFELQLSLRFDAGQALRSLIQEMGLYENRRQIQAMVFAVICIPMISISSLILYFVRKQGLAVLLAVSGTLWSVSLFCLPLISLHTIDRIMYYHIGPVMFISLLWGIGAAMTFIGAAKALGVSRNVLFSLPNQYGSHHYVRRTPKRDANSQTSRRPSTNPRALRKSSRHA